MKISLGRAGTLAVDKYLQVGTNFYLTLVFSPKMWKIMPFEILRDSLLPNCWDGA